VIENAADHVMGNLRNAGKESQPVPTAAAVYLYDLFIKQSLPDTNRIYIENATDPCASKRLSLKYEKRFKEPSICRR
jgi:hypothetical protein